MAGPAEVLLDAVLVTARGTPARVSLVGICKNAGKTTGVNQLIGAADRRRLGLALISTGRDGEEQDAITDLPKPRIRVPAGAWVATARDALKQSTATVSVLTEVPACHTPLGPVVLGRVTAPGEVLLVGPGSAQRVRDMLGAMESLSHASRARTDLMLVDGSFDRVAAAAPAVTGNVVLAVGASYSHSLKSTTAQAGHLYGLFSLPPVEPERWHAVRRAMAAAPVGWVTPDDGVEPLPRLSALTGANAVVEEAVRRLAASEGGAPRPLITLAGAVTDRLVQALVLHPDVTRRVGLAVRDATRVLADRQLWRRFRAQGGQAYVMDPVRVAALLCNPWSPTGQGYDPYEFVQAVAAIAPGRPVIDLVSGLVEVNRSADPETRA